ncbi:2-deoxy-scyllo-inosose synthase [Streptomyces sp. Wh19]|uniref:2-deoxy-scyllo-inosose synthase n=1 Tax=Streptomyces sp. Wh19 TaxID=3076629 RepID=UPI002958D043|nr:2-deoxy-scyllo-inosose synthase [Streptomyces sp. Wh19]MDV9194450.1 2-deoxy-scyllo-inosose synthase [Streptomyces sp. Wh19]
METQSGQSIAVDREVRFGAVRYPFHIRAGQESWVDLRRALTRLDADRFVVVADSGLPATTVAEAEAQLSRVAPTIVLSADATEKTKTLETVNTLAEQTIRVGATRQSIVVGLGGGLVGNVAGLLAGLVFRGIRLVHLPTTLLAMSDSTLSLKQGVNSRQGKNHIGVFHPPVLVWNHLDFLRTLAPEEVRSALCETVKNVLAITPERYDELARLLRTDARYADVDLAAFIDLCIDAKTAVMAEDHREKQSALVLEYGHTVGHAIELLSDGTVHHGFAIGLGMLAAARMSRELGGLDGADEAAHHELLDRNGALTSLGGFDTDDVLRLIRLDNKRGYVRPRTGACDFVLLDGLGRPRITNGSMITQVDEDTVRVGIASIQSEQH